MPGFTKTWDKKESPHFLPQVRNLCIVGLYPFMVGILRTVDGFVGLFLLKSDWTSKSSYHEVVPTTFTAARYGWLCWGSQGEEQKKKLNVDLFATPSEMTWNQQIIWIYPPPRMPVTTRMTLRFWGSQPKPSFLTMASRGKDPPNHPKKNGRSYSLQILFQETARDSPALAITPGDPPKRKKSRKRSRKTSNINRKSTTEIGMKVPQVH